MAITAAALQAELGADALSPQVIRSYGVQGTEQHWLIYGGATYPGRMRFVATTASDNAATQAASVATAMTG